MLQKKIAELASSSKKKIDTAITNKSTFFEQCLSHTSYTIITRSNKTVTTKKEFLKKGHTFKILVFPWYILNISSPQEICLANLECLFWNVSFVANSMLQTATCFRQVDHMLVCAILFLFRGRLFILVLALPILTHRRTIPSVQFYVWCTECKCK